MKKSIRILVCLILCSAFLAGCSTQSKKSTCPPHKPCKKEEQDGPPLIHPDVSKVPDAKPKIEPQSKYGNPPKYKALGKEYKVMKHSKGYTAEGMASWYGQKFHGKRTSSGEPYDMFSMTAAHPSLPLPTYAQVKNLENGKEVIVKINDRGPFASNRIIDLSYTAARKLGLYNKGTAKVRVTAIDPLAWNKEKTIGSKPSSKKTALKAIKSKPS